MKLFECQNCGQPLYFEDTRCESCGLALGYLPAREAVTALKQDGVQPSRRALGPGAALPRPGGPCSRGLGLGISCVPKTWTELYGIVDIVRQDQTGGCHANHSLVSRSAVGGRRLIDAHPHNLKNAAQK